MQGLIYCCLLFSILYGIVCGEEFVPPKKPNYDQLEKLPSSTLSKNADFQQACKEMAGYYKDPNKNPSLKNVIVMAGVNFGYLDFLYNFKCFADRIGVKFLPIALDNQIYTYLKESKLAPAFLMPDLPGRPKVANTPSGFGGLEFNLIGCRKLEVVLAALELGYDVIFTDVDIAWVRDPINHLFYNNIDYVHTRNLPCNFKWKFDDSMEGNTGFYSVRSNPQSIRTWSLAFKSCAQAPAYDDQTMYWLILRTNQNPVAKPMSECPAINGTSPNVPYAKLQMNTDSKVITTCPLSGCTFSASHLRDYNTFQQLVQSLTKVKQPAYTVHANWMNGRGKKKGALMRTGLWMVEQPSNLPQTFFMDLKQHLDKDQRNPNATLKMLLEGEWKCNKPNSVLMNLNKAAAL